MTNTDADTELDKALPGETSPQPARRNSFFSRADSRLPEVEQAEPSTTTGHEHEGDIVFEPVERQPYIISYVCVLIPRFHTHFLQGDVVAFLQGWMENIAISHSWKLEWTDIQRQYLQWMLSVPVTVPPAHFIRLIRHQTSINILTDFPHYTRENISRDFWAPGHLISVGRRPHSLEHINEYIISTRQQQGIYPPHRP